ncbi:alpha/beta hydrolase [Halocynthiibacter namhaensis]|uniref:alpha/beta hydrolase n=1 Tax=Halocynthiibacter namhaensis TaxID=1290553 RepID=UPI000691581B|nr:alpha/beta fold hydrolase [Halocynthiibacter namhaensis]
MRSIYLLIFLALTACSPRVTQINVVPGQLKNHTIPVFFATSRSPDFTLRYGSDRSEVTGYGQYDISIPPNHVTGQIEWPKRTPDALKHFVARSENLFSSPQEFSEKLARELRQKPRGERDVTIYVHGFLNSFADGIYRTAQLSNDFGNPDVSVHYSWPSAAHPLGYIHDRDSVLFARRGLEELINQVDAAGADSVSLVGHSMGALLSMEVLRTMAIRDNREMLRKVGGVFLVSADIDVDVFRSQLQEIGALPDPFILITSEQDQVLRLSAFATGLKQRVGSLGNPDEIADFDVTVINTSDYSIRGGHFNAGNSAELITILQRMQGTIDSLSDGQNTRTGIVPGAAILVQNATQILLPGIGQ